MTTIIIKLDSIDKVKKFVSITNCYEGKIEVSSGRCTVDGKSIMGIFSLDLKNDLTLNIQSEENVSALVHELEPYIIVSPFK